MRRKYSFKIDAIEDLEKEVELLHDKLMVEINDFKNSRNTDALKRYLLTVFIYRLENRVVSAQELDERMGRENPFYKLRGVSSHYNDVLNFLKDYPERILIYYDYIPHPLEVLKMQTVGKRPFSLFTKKEKMRKLVLGDKDYFSFFLHDLHHGEKFFSQELEGQSEFYLLLDHAFDANGMELYELFKDDLKVRLDYLLSDMNTHVVHSLRYLRALCDDVYQGHDGLDEKDALFWRFFNHRDELKTYQKSLLLLNRDGADYQKDGELLYQMVKNYS